MAQLSLAWCTKHPMRVDRVTGASKPAQVTENFAALDVIPLITDEVKQEIEDAATEVAGGLVRPDRRRRWSTPTRP